MKFFTPSALLAAALLSAVVVVPFLPAAKVHSETYAVEATMTCPTPGRVQAFYDLGLGFNEASSAITNLNPDAPAAVYRLPIPPGTYRALRFDPIDRAGKAVLHSLRVVSATGRVVREIPPKELTPLHQIASLQPRVDGSIEIVTLPDANDPQLGLTFAPPLQVTASWSELSRGLWPRALAVFAVLAAVLAGLDRAEGFQRRAARIGAALLARPARAIGIVAAVAVVTSAYPVVFLGKSYVSPNLGTTLLYDTYPTLPGYKSSVTTDVKLSDIGAVMWAHIPYSHIQHRALAQGELPLWDRYNSGGVPLLAQGQSMFGDPLHFLVIAANGAAWAWDLKYLAAKWLFAVGLGLTVLALVGARAARPPTPDAGDPPALPAALIVAAVAPFIGFFIYRLNHPAFFSLCYAPWPLYCLVRIAGAATRRALAGWCGALIVANLALMNSGTVKEAYMLLACVNFSGACILLASEISWRDRARKFAAVAWSGVLFVLITAPIWATFLQTLRNAYTGYNAASAYQIQPTLLLGLFDELFYRPLMSEERVFGPSLNFGLMLGVLYFAATLRGHFAHRRVIALAASSLVPLSLAFGLISPRWIVTLPFLSNIAHLDNTFSCALIVLWSVLAGVGFATAAQRLGTREGRNDLIVAGLLLFALVFGWIAFRQAAHRPILGPTFSVNQPGEVLAVSPFLWGYLWTCVAAIVVLALVLHASLARRMLTATRGLLVAVCAVVLLWRHGLHATEVGFENYVAHPTVRADFHARSNAIQLVRGKQRTEPSRCYGLHSNFFPGWTAVYGLEGIHGPDALVNGWMRDLAGLLPGVTRLWDWRLYVEVADVAKARPFLDAWNVRYYFDQGSDQGALGKALRLVATGDLDVYESLTAWPRAFFTDRIDFYNEPAEFVEKVRAAEGRPFAAAQRSDATAVAALARIPSDVATRSIVPATAYRLTENTTAFTVRASGPGVVLLNEVLWLDDFRATLNGRPAPVLRLNHAFKGVAIPTAGEYRIQFSYWPRNFTRNLALCGVGMALLAITLVLGARASRPLSTDAGGTPALPAA